MDKATPCNDLPQAYDQPQPYVLPPGYSNAGYMQPNYAQQPVYYPAPQGGLPGQQQQQATIIVVQPTTVINQLGYGPTMTDCSQCNSRVVTAIEYEIGSKVWANCVVLAILGLFLPCLWLGLCFIPFCVDGYKDVVHICPNCRHTIARVPRL